MGSIETVIYVTLGLLLLGILLAFSPTVVITELAILSKSKKPIEHTIFLMLGVAIPIVIMTALAFFLVDPDAEYSVPQTRHILELLPFLNVIIGALFIIAGLRIGGRGKKATEPMKQEKTATILNSKKLFWFGFIRTATRLTGIAAILMAAQLLKRNYESGVFTFVGIAWFAVVALAPLIVLLIMQRLNSRTLQRINTYSERVASISWRRVAANILLVAGIAFIIYGLFIV